MKHRLLAALAIILVLAGGIWWYTDSHKPITSTKPDTSTTTKPKPTPAPGEPGFDKTAHSLTEPASLWVIANKTRPLPSSYIPSDLRQPAVTGKTGKSKDELSLRAEAASAVEAMFAAASSDGVPLLLGSGYRSYQLQSTYYNNYVKVYGQAEADRVSAKPGTSEHQTGWAADFSGTNQTCYLETCFADQPAGKWLAAHAHEYGFTLRYKSGKEPITGYSYEPWHYRYVGKPLAAELQKENQTLEEFFGL